AVGSDKAALVLENSGPIAPLFPPLVEAGHARPAISWFGDPSLFSLRTSSAGIVRAGVRPRAHPFPRGQEVVGPRYESCHVCIWSERTKSAAACLLGPKVVARRGSGGRPLFRGMGVL